MERFIRMPARQHALPRFLAGASRVLLAQPQAIGTCHEGFRTHVMFCFASACRFVTLSLDPGSIIELESDLPSQRAIFALLESQVLPAAVAMLHRRRTPAAVSGQAAAGVDDGSEDGSQMDPSDPDVERQLTFLRDTLAAMADFAFEAGREEHLQQNGCHALMGWVQRLSAALRPDCAVLPELVERLLWECHMQIGLVVHAVANAWVGTAPQPPQRKSIVRGLLPVLSKLSTVLLRMEERGAPAKAMRRGRGSMTICCIGLSAVLPEVVWYASSKDGGGSAMDEEERSQLYNATTAMVRLLPLLAQLQEEEEEVDEQRRQAAAISGSGSEEGGGRDCEELARCVLQLWYIVSLAPTLDRGSSAGPALLALVTSGCRLANWAAAGTSTGAAASTGEAPKWLTDCCPLLLEALSRTFVAAFDHGQPAHEDAQVDSRRAHGLVAAYWSAVQALLPHLPPYYPGYVGCNMKVAHALMRVVRAPAGSVPRWRELAELLGSTLSTLEKAEAAATVTRRLVSGPCAHQSSGELLSQSAYLGLISKAAEEAGTPYSFAYLIIEAAANGPAPAMLGFSAALVTSGVLGQVAAILEQAPVARLDVGQYGARHVHSLLQQLAAAAQQQQQQQQQQQPDTGDSSASIQQQLEELQGLLASLEMPAQLAQPLEVTMPEGASERFSFASGVLARLRSQGVPLAVPAAEVVLSALETPEAVAAARLELAHAAATRSCAYLGCANVASEGGSEASEGVGKRCSGCRAVRYCGTACSHADWRGPLGHRHTCTALAAARKGQAA